MWSIVSIVSTMYTEATQNKTPKFRILPSKADLI
jgi:hypothetical protein